MSKKLSRIFQPNVFLDFGEGKIFSNKFAEGFAPPPKSGENQLYIKNDEGKYEPYFGFYDQEIDFNFDGFVPSVGVELGGDNTNNLRLNIQDVIKLYGGAQIIFHHMGYSINFDEKGKIGLPVLQKENGDVVVYASNEPNMRTWIVTMPQVGEVSHNGIIYSKGNEVVDGERFSVAIGGFGFDKVERGYIYDIRDMSVLLCADPRRFQPKAYVNGRDISKFEYGEDEAFSPEWSGFFPTDEDMNNKYYKTEDPHYYFMVNGQKTEYIWLALGSFIQMKTVVEVDDVGNKQVYWEVENNKGMVPMNTLSKGIITTESYLDGAINLMDKDRVDYNEWFHSTDWHVPSDALVDVAYLERSQRFQHDYLRLKFYKYHTDGKPWQWGAYILQ